MATFTPCSATVRRSLRSAIPSAKAAAGAASDLLAEVAVQSSAPACKLRRSSTVVEAGPSNSNRRQARVQKDATLSPAPSTELPTPPPTSSATVSPETFREGGSPPRDHSDFQKWLRSFKSLNEPSFVRNGKKREEEEDERAELLKNRTRDEIDAAEALLGLRVQHTKAEQRASQGAETLVAMSKRQSVVRF